MDTSTLGKTGAALSAAVLVLGGAVTVGACTIPGAAPAIASDAADAAEEAPGRHDATPVVGTFSYTQDERTDNSYFAHAFTKAVVSLCQATAQYHAGMAALEVSIADESFVATVDEMADESGVASMVTACACASNGPGGGAIGNAEVSGASIESIMAFGERNARKQ